MAGPALVEREGTVRRGRCADRGHVIRAERPLRECEQVPVRLHLLDVDANRVVVADGDEGDLTRVAEVELGSACCQAWLAVLTFDQFDFGLICRQVKGENLAQRVVRGRSPLRRRLSGKVDGPEMEERQVPRF